YAVPTHLALRAERRLGEAGVGYVGTAGDSVTGYSSAPNGNVAATARLPIDRSGAVTFALGFGRTTAAALKTAGAAAAQPFAATRARYQAGWAAYDARLRGTDRFSANVLKASEDKTFPGAVVASLASPWGQAVSASEVTGGKPVFFGSYREVF